MKGIISSSRGGYRLILLREGSRNRQMSGGRFLVSLKEVYRSESIIKVKTLLANNIELTTITSSLLTDEQSIAVDIGVELLIIYQKLTGHSKFYNTSMILSIFYIHSQ